MSEITNTMRLSQGKKAIDWLNSIVDQPQYFIEWKQWQKNLFRFFFIYLFILIIPLDWKFYRELFLVNWINLHLHDLLDLAKYQPQFFSEDQIPKWGIGSFVNWWITIVIAVVGAIIWGDFDRNKKEYSVLYYWLRVIVRYRLAVLLMAYGFIKLFPLQMPYPSLSNLHTNYGDFFAWKIYFQTLGIAPKYESFLGFVEILAGVLLFNRRTATFGAGLIFGFLGNVAAANGFYDIGEHITSTFIVLLALFLIFYDVPRLVNLLVKERVTYANKLIPVFSEKRLKKLRIGLRTAFLVYALLFGYKAYSNYIKDPYKIPKTPGLNKAYGFYNVKKFVLNKDTIPYSKIDPNRWQDVIFEKWSTLTINVNRPVKIDFSAGEIAAEKDIDRDYELAGFAGRHYFYYEADTVKHTLALQNKNKNDRNERLFLNYLRPNDSTIILSGINENRNSIYVLLERIEKKYLMLEGRRKPVNI